jgi:hypothetical protein
MVGVNGARLGPTHSIADVEQLAVDSYRKERNAIVARAVARRVIKKATIAAAKEKVGKEGLSGIGMDIAGIAWEASEGADTRCWGLLPRDIQVIRIEAPKGTSIVNMTPMMGGMLVGPSKEILVPVNDGANSYVLCWFPDSRSSSQVISSR